MDVAFGLLRKFKVNRPLSQKEMEEHLLRSQQDYSKPLYERSVIRMNSTYLECVDKFFMLKGCITTIVLILTGAFFCLGYLLVEEGIIVAILSVLVFILIKYALLKECFTYTHFPIRFNRKTRKVHVFRQDGTVMTEDWEKLYFTLCLCKAASAGGYVYQPNQDVDTYVGPSPAVWEVRGHRLAADGVTVLETFALPSQGGLYNRSQWQFVRCYMEYPDELPALADQIEHVIDIADKREGYWRGLIRLVDPVVLVLFLPAGLVFALGRWIAIHTSKIPQWPAEIEAECQFEPDDPWLRDAKHLAKPQPNKVRRY